MPTNCPKCAFALPSNVRSCPQCDYPIPEDPPETTPPGGAAGPNKKTASRAKTSANDAAFRRTCPRCRGKGKVRDASLLPWNNMAAFAVVLGIAGAIGSACVGQNQRALLLGSLVCATVGVVLYVLGESCPLCKGEGRLRHAAPPKRASQAAPSAPTHAAVPPMRMVRPREIGAGQTQGKGSGGGARPG